MDYSPWGHKESDRTEQPALPLLSERMADLKFKSGSVAPDSVLLRGDSLWSFEVSQRTRCRTVWLRAAEAWVFIHQSHSLLVEEFHWEPQISSTSGQLSRQPEPDALVLESVFGQRYRAAQGLGRKLCVYNSNCPLELQENSEVSCKFWGGASMVPWWHTHQTNSGLVFFKMLLEERLTSTWGISEWSPEQQHQHHSGAKKCKCWTPPHISWMGNSGSVICVLKTL